MYNEPIRVSISRSVPFSRVKNPGSDQVAEIQSATKRDIPENMVRSLQLSWQTRTSPVANNSEFNIIYISLYSILCLLTLCSHLSGPILILY